MSSSFGNDPYSRLLAVIVPQLTRAERFRLVAVCMGPLVLAALACATLWAFSAKHVMPYVDDRFYRTFYSQAERKFVAKYRLSGGGVELATDLFPDQEHLERLAIYYSPEEGNDGYRAAQYPTNGFIFFRSDLRDAELARLRAGKAILHGPKLLKDPQGKVFYDFLTDQRYRLDSEWHEHPIKKEIPYLAFACFVALAACAGVAVVLAGAIQWYQAARAKARADLILKAIWEPVQWDKQPEVKIRKCSGRERLVGLSPFLCEFVHEGERRRISLRTRLHDDRDLSAEPFKWVRGREIEFVVPVSMMADIDIVNRKSLPIVRHVGAA